MSPVSIAFFVHSPVSWLVCAVQITTAFQGSLTPGASIVVLVELRAGSVIPQKDMCSTLFIHELGFLVHHAAVLRYLPYETIARS